MSKLIIAVGVIVGGASWIIWAVDNPVDRPYWDTVAGIYALATFESCPGYDNALFTISGKGQLMTLSSLTADSSYMICIKEVGQ